MKEIKKYFKNAKRVECLMAGVYEIDLKTIYQDKDHRYWCRCHDTTDHCLLFENGDFAKIIEVKKPKQETLQEAAERHTYGNAYQNFIRGAKWQQEKSYTEEDMIQFAQIYLSKRNDNPRMSNKDIFNLWFKQFKKK